MPLSQSERGASEARSRGMPGGDGRGFPPLAGEMSEGQRGRELPLYTAPFKT